MMLVMAQEKTVAELLQEEKEKLLAEVDSKVRQKKKFITQEPETGFGNFRPK